MRHIFFRGKRTSDNRWIYGGILQTDNFSDISVVNDYDGSMYEPPSCDVDSYEVIPETVGQYTGLKDKNGKKIFEGDIVYCKSRLDNANMVVIFECGQFRMVLSENYHNYQTNSGFYDINCFDKKVIGNIHDNPELLKGGEG